MIDYTRQDFADGVHRYDVILDIGRQRGCRSCAGPSPDEAGW